MIDERWIWTELVLQKGQEQSWFIFEQLLKISNSGYLILRDFLKLPTEKFYAYHKKDEAFSATLCVEKLDFQLYFSLWRN